MLARAAKPGPQQGEFYDQLASEQLKAELASYVAKKKAQKREADAKRRLPAETTTQTQGHQNGTLFPGHQVQKLIGSASIQEADRARYQKTESLQAQTMRFKQDRKTRRCIQEAVWRQFDVLQTLIRKTTKPRESLLSRLVISGLYL
ncbi:hypothetical protein VE03_10663, partial [Pseudogymnoascus sp. 23342-1-I1]